MSVSTTLRNVRATIENAIVDNLQFANGARLPPAADVPTLRSMASAGLPDRVMRYVTSTGFAWQLRKSETSADDGINFVQPADVIGSNPGRWCKASLTGVTSTAQTGYLRKCEIYNDDSGDLDIFQQRLFGNTPALLLSFDSIKREPKSTEPGALYWCRAHYTLFAVDVNARGRLAALQGSPVASEVVNEPGTEAMLGDAKLVLAGIGLGINDVAYVQIEDEYPLIRDLARARYIETLELTVFYTETNPDTSLIPLLAPYSFNANFELADTNSAGVLDTSNDVITNGLQFALGNSLTQSFAGGTMNFNGSPLVVSGAPHTFSANSVTYRDISATGVLTYTTTNVGDPPPPLGFGLVRLGATVTDAAGVRLDRLLAASLIPFGPIDKVSPGLLTSIAISPTSISVPNGTPVQFTAIGTYEGGQADAYTVDITALVSWASDNGNTTFTPSGVANTSAPGTAHITATLNGVTSNTATLTAT